MLQISPIMLFSISPISAHYARFNASLDCIMLALLYAESSWIDVTEQDLCI